jgi:hypothetical protein
VGDVISERVPAQLSRLDRFALGVGFSMMFITNIWPPIGFAVTFAIFMPPALREVGLLKDGDRRMLSAMRRAGFQAFLVLVAMFLVSHQLVRQGILTETINSATPILNESYIRGILVGTYLVSYLLQVLGPQRGSFGVLLGAAILVLAPVPAHFLRGVSASLPLEGVLAMVALSVLLVSLALLVRARPILGGWLLSGLFVVAAILLVSLGIGRMPIESVLSALLQTGLVFGCTGVVLLRSRSRCAL